MKSIPWQEHLNRRPKNGKGNLCLHSLVLKRSEIPPLSIYFCSPLPTKKKRGFCIKHFFRNLRFLYILLGNELCVNIISSSRLKDSPKCGEEAIKKEQWPLSGMFLFALVKLLKRKAFQGQWQGSPMSNKADPACCIPPVTVTPAGHRWDYIQLPHERPHSSLAGWPWGLLGEQYYLIKATMF